MDSLARALRNAASSRLPGCAFLRRDRGEALFVTDAPRLRPETDWPAALSSVGFDSVLTDGLLRLWPGAHWLTRLEADWPDPPSALCASLHRFRERAPEAECLRLFALGTRCLDGGDGATRFDRLLRQHAAACLRLNALNPQDPPRGGGLYACALIDYALVISDGGASSPADTSPKVSGGRT